MTVPMLSTEAWKLADELPILREDPDQLVADGIAARSAAMRSIRKNSSPSGVPNMADRGTIMETIAVPFLDDAADRIERAAAERYAGEREASATLPTPDEQAAMARAVADIAAGRLVPHDEVFARLDAKHGWGSGERP